MFRLAEWLVEEGIGETRAILVEGGRILAARVAWDGDLRAGTVAAGQLVDRQPGTRRGTVRLDDGSLALADGLDGAMTEGVRLVVRVTRAAIAERGRTKLPLVRPAAAGERPAAAPSLAGSLAATGLPVRTVPLTGAAFADAGWDDLVEEATSGCIAFPGGSLTISPTPAMTLVDIDGTLPPAALARAAVPALAAALHRHDIGGSVGLDFPTLAARADRLAVDAALAAALDAPPLPWRGERTAMNGFGFVHLVARLEGPSLVARFARHPAAAAARDLLRRAERAAGPGTLLVTLHPAVRRAVRPEWEAALVRRTGQALDWREDAALALHGGFAQAVSP